MSDGTTTYRHTWDMGEISGTGYQRSRRMSNNPFATWGILELMGYRRLGGFIQEAQIAGASFLRIDFTGARAW